MMALGVKKANYLIILFFLSLLTIYIYIYNVLKGFLCENMTKASEFNDLMGDDKFPLSKGKQEIRCANIKAGAIVRKEGKVESYFFYNGFFLSWKMHSMKEKTPQGLHCGEKKFISIQKTEKRNGKEK